MERCSRCRLGLTACRQVPGEGNLRADLLIVGEAPGKQEDQTGRPFVGPSGRFLRHCLQQVGIEPHRCFFTNLVRCMPKDETTGRFRKPEVYEVDACADQFTALVNRIRPRRVLFLGSVAQQIGPALLEKAVSEIIGGVVLREGEDAPTGPQVFLADSPALIFKDGGTDSPRYDAYLTSLEAVITDGEDS